MEWSGKINSWAWVKHLKYIEKRRGLKDILVRMKKVTNTITSKENRSQILIQEKEFMR